MATILAERMSKFSGSPTSALIAKVAELKRQGKDIISLNVGEPDFGTPDYIKVAGIKAITDSFTKYTPGNGILELREEIIKKLKKENGIEYALNEVTTAVGAKQAIASTMMVIAGPGDEVLLPIPCWVSYTEMIRLGCFRNWHRAVVRRAAYGEPSSAFPVSLLQGHPDLTLTFTDYVAALSDGI
mgnify:CR=1 FL=1